MPFPWRKVKGRRISQLVNDHLQNSRKRRDGSSLVVETGFPTSLVDLVMKNREKLKKKKRARASSDDSDDPLPPPCPPPVLQSSGSADVNQILDVRPEMPVAESDGNSNSSSGFLIAFKVFMVVFFVLITNRLTTGITISVFLLFLLEHTGSFASRILKRTAMNDGILVQGKKSTEIVDSATQIEEIEEEESPTEDSTSVGNEEEASSNAKAKKPSKRAKMKAKVKKFFAKTFKAGKGKGSLRSEEQQVNKPENNRESQGRIPEKRDEDAMPPLCEIPKGPKKQGMVEASGAHGFLALVLVILVGLAGGQSFAILLAVFFCFLPKFLVNRWGFR